MSARGLLTFVLLIFVATRVWAADGTLNVSAALGGVYDDNRYLVSGGHDDFSSSNEALSVDYGVQTDTTTLGAGLRIYDEYTQQYPEGESDSVSAHVNGKQVFERSSLSGGWSRERSSALQSEIQATGPVSVNIQRYRDSWYGGTNYHVTEQGYWGLSWRQDRVGYDDSVASELNGYRYTDVETRYDWHLSERTGLGIGLFGNGFENEDNTFRSDTRGVKLSLTRELSEYSRLKLEFGRRSTDYTRKIWIIDWSALALLQRQIRQEGTGSVSDLSWTVDGRLLNSTFTISRNLEPNSLGDLIEKRKISENLLWTRNQRFSVSLEAACWTQRSEESIGASDDLNSIWVAITAHYRVTRNLYVNSRLRRLDRKLLNPTDSAGSNQISIDIKWFADPTEL